jgi:hypothetical protein
MWIPLKNTFFIHQKNISGHPVIPFKVCVVNLHIQTGNKEKIHNKFITAYILQYQLIAAVPPSTTNKPFYYPTQLSPLIKVFSFNNSYHL